MRRLGERSAVLGYLLLGLACASLEVPPSDRFEVMWEESETDISGRISADGRWLPYVDWTTGDLALRDLWDRSSRRITEASGDLSEYAGSGMISPRGDRIAFVWYTPASRRIQLAPFSGGGSPELLAPDADLHDWSPDGEALLIFVDSTRELGYLVLATGGFRRFVRADGRISEARVSPDGEYVAFSEMSAEDPTQREIRIVELASGVVRTVVSGDGDDHSPVWAPDGSSLVYVSNRGGKPRLWRKRRFDADAGDPGESVHDLPDAAVVVLGADREGTLFLGTYDRGAQQVFIGRVNWAEGSVRDQVEISTPPHTRPRRPVFGPNGERIAFMQKARGFQVRPGWQIPVVRSLEGEDSRAYPTHLTLRDDPLWSADGTALLFAAPPERTVGEGAGERWSFYRLDLNDGSYTEIGRAATPGLVRVAGATATTLTYVINRYDENTASAFQLDFTSQGTSRLYRGGGVVRDAAVSPDGSTLVLMMNTADGNRSLYTLTPPDSVPARIADVRPNTRGQLAWLPDGDAILTGGRIAGEQGIWRVPLDGLPPQRLNLPADVTEVCLSSDAQRIAFTRTDRLPRQVLSLRNVF